MSSESDSEISRNKEVMERCVHVVLCIIILYEFLLFC